jgi:aldehyde dehydrogenase (NAD+)
MREVLQFYIGGARVEPLETTILPVINPATEAIAGHVALGSAADVDRAVAAARQAFAGWSQSPREERLVLLARIIEEYRRRYDDIAAAVTEEMGAPRMLAHKSQARLGLDHLEAAAGVLRDFCFQEQRGSTLLVKEPIGVCGFITPWNWPLNQIACKVVPALLTGCTMVLKPSEIAPFSAQVWSEVLHAAGVPAGVYNLVHGDGPTVGAALAAHPDVDMVSFTGSARAGVEVARTAATTVKRVHPELGGRSPYIVLEDADLEAAVNRGIVGVMNNSGQSCNAPTRMLVPRPRMGEAAAQAKAAAEKLVVGDPQSDADLGPVVSQAQWDKVQRLIHTGIEEGATLVTGGPGRPAGLERGYYVKPTVFADVQPAMAIAREEIFGPVLVILGYESQEDAIANDTEYGLAAYIAGNNPERVREVATKVRAGQVNLNGAKRDMLAPFGGYKRSGNGREWGAHAFNEFLETKAVLGWAPA